VIALVGDGAMQMNGINGLITVAKYWRQWGNAKLVIVVLKNGDLNEVTWEQRALGGDPRYAPAQGVPDFPYAAYAELIGLRGIHVARPQDIAQGWDDALAADRPCVLEMVTDPNVPPLPPDVTLKQAGAYMSALLKGDPDSLAIVKATIKETWDSWFPPKAPD
jgi:pyruvate dehydrogenase (quinone)